jgi:protein FAM32A
MNREDSAYKAVLGGKLNLKGSVYVVFDVSCLHSLPRPKPRTKSKKEKRSKKDKKSKKEKKDKKITSLDPPTVDPRTEVEVLREEYLKLKQAELEVDHRTESQRRYDEKRRQNLLKEAPKEAQVTFREKVEKYNKLLASIPEHHDIPKIGPG